MSNEPITILTIGIDDELVDELTQDEGVLVERADRLGGVADPGSVDVVLLSLDGTTPLEALSEIRAGMPNAAVVVVTDPSAAAETTPAYLPPPPQASGRGQFVDVSLQETQLRTVITGVGQVGSGGPLRRRTSAAAAPYVALGDSYSSGVGTRTYIGDGTCQAASTSAGTNRAPVVRHASRYSMMMLDSGTVSPRASKL